MYGLLFDSIQKFLRERYGEHYWANIRRRAKLKNHWFVTHEVYSDSLMKELVEAAAEGVCMCVCVCVCVCACVCVCVCVCDRNLGISAPNLPLIEI